MDKNLAGAPRFHGGNTGSIPVGHANEIKGLAKSIGAVSNKCPINGDALACTSARKAYIYSRARSVTDEATALTVAPAEATETAPDRRRRFRVIEGWRQ